MPITLTPVSATEKVYIKEPPRPLTTPVLLFTGDVAHLQLTIGGDVGYTTGEVRFEGPLAHAIGVQRVGYVPVILDYPTDGDDYYEIRPEKLYPDVLEAVDPRRLNSAPGYNQTLLLTVTDDDTIPVGDTVVRVRFLAEWKPAAECEFVIRKLAARLPEQKCLSTCWMHYDSFIVHHNVRLFTKEFYRVFASYLDAARYSGQNMILVPLFTPAFDTEMGQERRTAQLLDIREDEDGGFHFDFTAMHAFIDFVMARGMKYLEMPPLFTQWGANHAPKIMVRSKGGRLRRRFGWETDSLSEEYRRFLTALLPALVAELRARGLEEVTFFHVSDEPKPHQKERYYACKEMVMPLLGNCKTLDACGDIAFAGRSPREYAVPLETKLREFSEAGVRPLCTYFCGGPRDGYYPNRLLSMPLPRLVVLGAALYRYDIDLFLHWGFNFYNTFVSRREITPYGNTDCDVRYPGGDGFIVYPDYGGRGARMSLRLLATREMFRLSRILYLLEEKMGREETLALLDSEGVLDINVYPRKDGWLDTLLLHLADRLG